jgi:oxygen-dependent protoporphyrinogen oxidase
MPHVAVVGAGIAGLTAAYELQRAGWQVDVFEASDRVGGRVKTVEKGPYVVDVGAFAIAARYPVYTALAKSLGVQPRETSPYVAVFHDGRLHELRLDKLAASGLRTRLLSWPAKLRLARVAANILLAKLRGQLVYEDLRAAAALDCESGGSYVRRLAGEEADRLFADPMMRVLTFAKSKDVSRVEVMSGLINAMAGKLTALPGGQQTLTRELANRLRSLRLNTAVEQVTEGPDRVEVTYTGNDGQLDSSTFDACVVACPLPIAAGICQEHDDLARLAKEVEFGSVVSVVIGTSTRPTTPAFLILLPTEDDEEVAAVYLEHNKLPGRAPDGHGLFVVHWDMSSAPNWITKSDEELVQRALETTTRIFPEVRDKVEMTYVQRWPVALPMTRTGAFRAIGEFTNLLDPNSRIQFAGDWLSQTGQNTAVSWAQKAANQLIGNSRAFR